MYFGRFSTFFWYGCILAQTLVKLIFVVKKIKRSLLSCAGPIYCSFLVPLSPLVMTDEILNFHLVF